MILKTNNKQICEEIKHLACTMSKEVALGYALAILETKSLSSETIVVPPVNPTKIKDLIKDIPNPAPNLTNVKNIRKFESKKDDIRNAKAKIIQALSINPSGLKMGEILEYCNLPYSYANYYVQSLTKEGKIDASEWVKGKKRMVINYKLPKEYATNVILTDNRKGD